MFVKIIFIIIVSLISYSLIPTYIYKAKHKLCKKNKGKTLYLTFDDGPHKKYTVELMDLLKKYNIKASFFVVANFAKENPEIIERMKMEGHVIGLHSLEHRNALYQSKSYTEHDFKESMNIMKNLDVDIKYFRPPWGHFNIITCKEIKKYNLKPVMWDVMAQDWEGDTLYEIISEKLLRRSKNNHIICLHDGRGEKQAPSRTIRALEKVIPIWQNEGYEFLTVEDIYE